MMNLKQSLKLPLRPPTSFVIAVLVIALVGFVDASYLTVEHYQGVIPPCTLVEGCETVLSSAYSVVLGIPVSLLGAIYYLLILVGAFAYLEGKHHKILRFCLSFSLAGFIASLWFLYLQAFVLDSYCIYCLLSTLTSTLLFILTIFAFKKYATSS